MKAEYDPVTDLKHWPIPMAKYGKTPYGGNLYRIVLASSRRHLVGGCWPDGEIAYHWVPKYRKIESPWILERWSMPVETRRQWDSRVDPVSGWLINGPYPDRGDYDLAWEFSYGVDADNLDTIVGAIERGRQRSFEDIRQAHKAEYAAEEKETRSNTYDEIRDAYTAYGSRPFAGGHVSRGTKTITPQKTAEELGLPIPRAKVKEPLKITSRRTVDLREMQVTNSLIAGRI